MIPPLFLLLIVLVLAVVAYLVLRRAAPRREPPRAPRPPVALPTRSSSSTPALHPPETPLPAANVPERPLPPALAAFHMTHAQDLATAQRDTLVEALRHIPRPPRSLHQLISPDFLATATSTELSELVMSEPLIAAKVLSTVNSPLYGLQRSVTSIGQAITFLGMNTVRSICLRYLLDESFKTSDPATRRVFEQLWTASAIASELCSRLAKQLHLADAGSLVTKVVLSFVGHMAVATLPPSRENPALNDLSLDLVQRYSAQQQALGLCAPEIGRLLMQAWALPEDIVHGVGDMDRALTEAGTQLEPLVATRRALAYLCARLGERLASGSPTALSDWRLATDSTVCMHHLSGYVPAAQQAAIEALLRAPDTQTTIDQLLGKGQPAR